MPRPRHVRHGADPVGAEAAAHLVVVAVAGLGEAAAQVDPAVAAVLPAVEARGCRAQVEPAQYTPSPGLTTPASSAASAMQTLKVEPGG